MGLANEKVITRVEDLLAGRIVIPSIQRDYVWLRPDVRDLLDSLYKGYPVGALLLWKTDLEVPFRNAAVVQTEQSTHQPLYLLGGQQRLTSLAWVYRPESKTNGQRIDIRFDVRTEEFVNPSAVQRRDPLLVPVSDVLQENAQYFPLLTRAGIAADSPDFQIYYDRLKRLHDIRTSEVAVITYQSDDYEEVADVFARVNKGGRRLSKGDLVYSAIAARWSDGLDTMDAFHEELDGIGFALHREAVLRLMSLLAGKSARHIQLLHKDMTGDALKRAWGETEVALRHAIDFLRDDCGIPRSAVLTSPNVVTVPGLLLHHRQGRPTAEEAELLRRWVYTAMAFSHFSLQVETKLDAEARLIRSRQGEDLLLELIRRASGTRSMYSLIQPIDLEHKYASHAFFNLLYIAALRRPAKDWATNVGISDQPLVSGSKIEYHHIFPKALAAKLYPKELWNSLANLAFVSGQTNKLIGAKSPATYMPNFDPARLAEQWIPDDPALREVDRFPDFLEARRVLLAGALNEMLGLTIEPPWGDYLYENAPPEDDGDLFDGPEPGDE